MEEPTSHPAADLFPMMDGDDLKKLAGDIGENGLLEPVVLYEGQVLDGRNRLAACKLAGVEPKFVELDGTLSSPALYVISKNLHRRHLTVSQRATIAAKVVPLLAEEARKRQGGSGRFGGSPPIGGEPDSDSEVTGRSAEVAAQAVGVGRRTVERALKAKRENPAAFERMKEGKTTAWAAERAAPPNKRAGRQPGQRGRVDKDAPYDPDTHRKRQLAEGQKRRMEVGLSTINGVCRGLADVDVRMVTSVCTAGELRAWADKARELATALSSFAKKLEKRRSA